MNRTCVLSPRPVTLWVQECHVWEGSRGLVLRHTDRLTLLGPGCPGIPSAGPPETSKHHPCYEQADLPEGPGPLPEFSVPRC